MKKGSILIGLALGVTWVMALFSTPCRAAEPFKPVTLKYSTYVAQTSWHGEMHQWWGNEVDKRTGGRVK
ncbi:MAG: hypothetical protein EHM36_05215, partial [Deltaproteobacteria bacterium]